MRNSLTGQHTQQQNKSRLNIGFDPAEKGADKSVVMTIPTNNEKVIAEKICSITTLAVLNATVLHIDVEYVPWLSSFTVKVFEVNTDYMKAHPSHFLRLISLERQDALNKLKDLEDLLIDMIADAKDKEMGAV